MFPGGSSAYTAAPVEEQPILMNLLARLLDRNLHPAIPPASAAAYVVSIRDAATKLRDAVQALAGPSAELNDLVSRRGRDASRWTRSTSSKGNAMVPSSVLASCAAGSGGRHR